MSGHHPTFHLSNLLEDRGETKDFEGPLQLILMLLSKQKIAIRDIQISVILDQYLKYIEEMQEMDLEIASEFVQMASHLIYLKTRTLLATENERVSEVDMLISSLEQLQNRSMFEQMKEILPFFEERIQRDGYFFEKLPEPRLPKVEYTYTHKPYELLEGLLHAISRSAHTVEETEIVGTIPRPIVYGVKEKSKQLIGMLTEYNKVSLSQLYAQSESRTELVATFISILELCSGGYAELYQENGNYILKKVCTG